ncbi:gamma-glutamylcyclotransferase family protein [Pseudoalteromonas luteoviolacea]|uniref:gamma-glutamylcyclotransferase family protein n=1 Tax=Pseudoalteromonas luteoviolacea TaxID=43657 RepID=UPI001B37CAE0|nr:gamma-glutamylcyclotransferase family protein [Pseudoalteromonas luteoviolacea]MBQ4838379.1 gamma-glutamylcyclotransferase [Pseudoalteromonas luteoviolacea]
MQTDDYFYFAYGSNLSTLRLKQRLPNARLIGTAILQGHQLTFDMLSKDGSAKCNIASASAPMVVYGVVYGLTQSEIVELDNIEGPRYDRVVFNVDLMNRRTIAAHCYVANTFVSNQLPFTWYKQHVLNGALEHGFPAPYVERIKMQKSIVDENENKHILELNIYKK